MVRNYSFKHILAHDFQCIIQGLADSGTPLDVEQVVKCHANGKPYPPRSFLISFDDGFENNFSIAASILHDLGMPAVFYISTDFIENNSMSWVDRMEYALERSSSRELRLPWENAARRIDGAHDKIAIMSEARRYIKSDPVFDIDRFLVSFCRDCEEPLVTSSNDPLDLKMSWDQVKTLAAEPLFKIGGHSHQHVVLSFLPQNEMEAQLDLSLGLLSQHLGEQVRHYSYPEGLAHCYSDGVIEALKSRGVVCCPTAEDGINEPGTDLFRLKRVMVQ